MKRLTLVGLVVLTALALTSLTPAEAGCRGGRCSARAGDGPRRPVVNAIGGAVGGVGRVVGKILPPWRK